jgi:MFS family permease
MNRAYGQSSVVGGHRPFRYNRRFSLPEMWSIVASLSYFLLQVERWLFGRLPEDVRFNARLELVATLAYGIFFAGSLSFFPVILRRLGADTNQLALYVTLTYLGSVLTPLGLRLTRNLPPMSVTTWGWALGRSLFALAIFATGPVELLIIVGVFWIAETIPVPSYIQIMQRIYPPAFRGRAMAGVRMGMTIVILLVTPLFGWLLDHVGFKILFGIAALFGVLSGNIFGYARMVTTARTQQAAPSRSRGLLQLLREDRRFAFYLLVLTVYGFGSVMALPLFPIVQVNRLQLSYTQIGTLGLVQSSFWLIGFIFWGRLLDRHGSIWLLRVAMTLAALVSLTYMFATNIWLLVPAFIIQGLMQGAFDLGVTNASIELAGPERVMEYSALQTATIGVRGMIAPFISAWLLNHGIADTVVFGICVALIFAGALMMGPLMPRRDQVTR